jgi:HNH endonuclease
MLHASNQMEANSMETWKPIKCYASSDDKRERGRAIQGAAPCVHARNIQWLQSRVFTSTEGSVQAEALIYYPQRKKVVDHNDRNILNSHVSNLLWATHSENSGNTVARKHNKLGVKNVRLIASGMYLVPDLVVEVEPGASQAGGLTTQKVWGEYAFKPVQSCKVK